MSPLSVKFEVIRNKLFRPRRELEMPGMCKKFHMIAADTNGGFTTFNLPPSLIMKTSREFQVPTYSTLGRYTLSL